MIVAAAAWLTVVAADHEAYGWPDLLAMVWADPAGRWVLYLLAVVVFGFTIWRAIAKIRNLLLEFRDDVKDVRDNVSNDHTKNLRVEQDERHADNTVALTRIDGKLDTLIAAVGVLDYRVNDNRSRIDQLEQSNRQ